MAGSGIEYGDIDRLALNYLHRAEEFLRLADLSATISTDVPYAPYVIVGTRPHDIYPRNGAALFWKGAAHPVAHVHHPGYKGHDFIAEGEAAAMPLLVTGIAETMARMATGDGTANLEAAYRAGITTMAAEIKARANVKTGTLRDSFTTRFNR